MADVENDRHSASVHPSAEYHAGTTAYTGQEDNDATRDYSIGSSQGYPWTKESTLHINGMN